MPKKESFWGTVKVSPRVRVTFYVRKKPHKKAGGETLPRRKPRYYHVMVKMGKRATAYDYHGQATAYANIKASSAASAKRIMRRRIRITSNRDK